MSTHNGKIGRLPSEIREQLNQRLFDGETATTLLPWLNSLPAMQTLLAERFAGQPVSEQNLSQWRTGGYEQWQKQQERRAIAAELAQEDLEMDGASASPEMLLNQRLTRVLTADFALAARELLNSLTDPAERCRHLQKFLHTLKFQRREDILTQRLKMAMERHARECREAEEPDDSPSETASVDREFQMEEIEKRFSTLDLTSQAKGVTAAESLLQSMERDVSPDGPPVAGRFHSK
jgi:hypothetical protein